LTRRDASRRRPQHVLVELGGELEHGQHPAARIRALLLFRAELLELDPGALGQELQGAALVGLLD